MTGFIYIILQQTESIMNFKYNADLFPVSEVIQDVRNQLENDNTVILSAPPGAGKSTVLPLMLIDICRKWGRKIIMLEPRRMAAVSIAERMSDMIGEKVGKSIGYRIRFETRVSEETIIEVVTEGILTRMLQSDNSLEGIGMIIFDEFHERNLNSDIALALCREVQQILRPELRILIMSATLDISFLSSALTASVIESKGRSFPVDINYCGYDSDKSISFNVAENIIKASKKEKGDILAFLPGEGEINKCSEILEGKIPEDTVLISLFGRLSHESQQRAIEPDRKGRRKIILSTPIAETSLTIEGVSVVIDSGFCRTLRYNQSSGMSRLETERISLDMATQRTGRAGRLGPGVCYRLWNKAIESQMSLHRTPEIEFADLAPLMLDLAAWGVSDIESLFWVTLPPKKSVFKAVELLQSLKAIDNTGKLTSHGKDIHKIAAHPRIANMLIKGKENDRLSLATDIAAIIEERDPMPEIKNTDINLRIEKLRSIRYSGENLRNFSLSERVARSYRKMFCVDVDNNSFSHYDTGLLISYVFPERIAKSIGHGKFQLAGNTRAKIDLTDDMAHEDWIAVAGVNGNESDGTIFLASPLNIKDVEEIAAVHCNLSWDTRKGGLIAQEEFRIGKLTLKCRPLNSPDKEIVKEIICKAIESEGKNLLNFSDDVEIWQNRVLSARIWQPETGFPDVTTNSLLKNCREWLLPYLDNITKNEDLKKIDLIEALQYHLSYEQQQLLEELVPLRIEVPSGSKIKLQYFSDGSQPVLAVRIQECFGLQKSPAVCNGKIPVLMHLLSPGFKPVQITSDLNSFWDNTYSEVKKELKRRYPKHVWPDDPRSEPAIRGTKKQQNR